jgi:hypothetical protein
MRPAGNLAGVEFLAPPLYDTNAPLWSYIISNSGYFFTKSAARWFSSRISWSSLTLNGGGQLFITSEQDSYAAWNGERRYTVRSWNNETGVDTVGEFGGYDTMSKARAELKKHLTN